MSCRAYRTRDPLSWAREICPNLAASSTLPRTRAQSSRLLAMFCAISAALAFSPGLHLPSSPAVARATHPAMEAGVASLPPTAAQKTWFPKSADTAASAKSWYVVDAEGMRLGRMASECAKILLGKNKAEFTPGADVGDAVVIINAEKVIVTGKKAEDKLYRRHSGRPGGMKLESYNELQVSVAR